MASEQKQSSVDQPNAVLRYLWQEADRHYRHSKADDAVKAVASSLSHFALQLWDAKTVEFAGDRCTSATCTERLTSGMTGSHDQHIKDELRYLWDEATRYKQHALTLIPELKAVSVRLCLKALDLRDMMLANILPKMQKQTTSLWKRGL